MKIDVVKRYFELLEQFSTNEADYREILHPEIEQTEYPNQLTDHVAVSHFETLLKRIPNGRKLVNPVNPRAPACARKSRPASGPPRPASKKYS